MIAIPLIGLLVLSSCATETVIYHIVPEWQLRQGIVPEGYVDENGVRHVNRARVVKGLRIVDPDDPNASAGQVTDADGNVRYYAMLPEQVLSATIELLVEEDFKTMWDHVLSERTKQRYREAGGGYEDFERFMQTNRNELFTSLNRMAAEVRQPSVIIEPLPGGGQRMRFHRHFAKEYTYSTVDTIWEDGGLKLLMIHPTYQD